MADTELIIRFITKKTKSIEGLKNILQPSWPNILITQSKLLECHFTAPLPGAVIIDDSITDPRELTSFLNKCGEIPVIIVSNSKKVRSEIRKSDHPDFELLTTKEFKSSAIIYLLKHMIDQKRLVDKLKDATKQLRELSVKDDLTGLFNKRHIDEILFTEFRKSKRYGASVSAILIGVDGLKHINETHGYDTGSHVLCEFSAIIQNSIRDVDVAGRIAGDEFLIILPETDLDSARVVGERILREIHNTKFANGRLANNPTGSIGIADCRDDFKTNGEWAEGLRQALFAAKHSGKNCVWTYEDIEISQSPHIRENTELISQLHTQIDHLTEETKTHYFKALLNLVENLPFYKQFIVPHSERVAFYAEKLAAKIGMQKDEAAAIKRSGLLHDIGKVAIDKKILLKNKTLNHVEFELCKQHPVFATQIIGHPVFWKNETTMILHHHEKFDGSGYPDKLNGEHIPLGARILAIAEAWDTMTNDQAYRPALTLDRAIDEIKLNAGTQFDPELTKIFTGMIEG